MCVTRISPVCFIFFVFHKLWVKMRHFEQCDVVTVEITFSLSPGLSVAATLVTDVGNGSGTASFRWGSQVPAGRLVVKLNWIPIYCQYLCACAHAHLHLSTEVRKWCQIPWKWRSWPLRAARYGCLDLNSSSRVRAMNTNCWAFSPAPSGWF